jgi:Na+/phosphate symporter
MTHTPYFFPIMTALYIGGLVLHIGRRHAAAKVLVMIGVFLNISFLVRHATITKVLIWNALVDPVFFIPLVIGVTVLFLCKNEKTSTRSLGLVFLFLIGATFFAAFYPKGVIPPAANKTGLAPFLFFFFENSAYALFGASGVLAITSSRSESSVKIARRLAVLGFISFSVAQVVGALWSFLSWGHPFMWGSRHLSSAAVWLIYAALIHMRFLSSSSVSERGLTMASALVAIYIAYSHLVFELGMPRIGG